ncbi:MAG: 8-oxo-dGTP diphosphatase [Spirochaetales bacterium]
MYSQPDTTTPSSGSHAFGCRDFDPLIPWNKWEPKETAVLCFIRDGEDLLLIEKKRGLGQGKINGPGGRIEPGESAENAAVRETWEEVGLTPKDLTRVAELSFQFADGYGLHCTVFFSNSYSGTLRETEEAAPFWCRVSNIPYDRMWADDRHWLPMVLNGARIDGKFTFDGDEMLSCRIQTVDRGRE